MSYTPGPWIVGEKPGVWVGPVVATPGMKTGVAFVVGGHSEPASATARLIAAAPELLAACRAALAYFDTTGHGNDWRDAGGEEPDILAAAIAKAEGRDDAT